MTIVKIKRSFLAIPLFLVLFGVGVYFVTRHSKTSVAVRGSSVVLVQPKSVAAADPADDRSHPYLAHEASERPESPSTRDYGGASLDSKESKDFSGVTTLDPATPAASSTAESTPEPEQKTTSPLPLVFQTVDPKSMKIAPDQQKIIDQLQQSFLDQIGDASQDPNDPRYRERWEQALRFVDQQLKGQLGQQFFLQYQVAAGQSAAKRK